MRIYSRLTFRFFMLLALLASLFGIVPTLPVQAALEVPTVDQFLNPDGTLDLKSSYTGSLDVGSYGVILDPVHGPVFNATPLVDPAAWNGLGTTPLNSGVTSIAISGTDVYAGGYFTNAGGDVNADYIAKWNGSTWSALGATPLNGVGGATVFAIATSGTDVYVGGDFEDAGGDANADYIAKWNGASWSSLGATPLMGKVYAITIKGTDVYVGGDFLNAGGDANADYIAKWNGSAWSALGTTPLSYDVYAIAVNGTDVYAGGQFSNAGGDANADYIAKWNGSVWSALGTTPLNERVQAITINGTDIYVGGNFTNAGGDPNADSIAKWNGSAWSALGTTPLIGGVDAIAVSGVGDVYVGGAFINMSGDLNADAIVKWNGSTWSGLGTTPLYSTVSSIAIHGTDLYAGGSFIDAGADVNADYIAMLTIPTFTLVNSNADTIADDGVCTLREAITNANGDSQLYATAGECAIGAGSDTITFAADYTITVGSTLPIVTTTLTINGNDTANTIIQANVNPNTATYGILKVGGTLTIDKLTIQNGGCYYDDVCTSGVFGGGIYNAGILTVTNSSFLGNNSYNGGGIYSVNTFAPATLTVTNSIFSGNKAAIAGGAIYGYGSVTVSNSTFSDNVAVSGGGGIMNFGTVTVKSSAFSDNVSGYGGGGIMNYNSLTVANSTFLANATSGSGGAISNFPYANVASTLNVVNSTFVGNSAANGGGISDWDSYLTVLNSTFSGNSASSAGGGIWTNSNGVGINPFAGLLKNTIIANSTSGGNCSGGVLADAHNLATDNTCNSATQKTSAEINLAPLANNGGSTQTMALGSGSAAIDMGNPTVCADVNFVNNLDQRAVTRPIDGDGVSGAICDIGAYEAPDISPFVLSSMRASPTPSSLATVDFIVTFSESVTGVNADDFNLTTSGVSAAAVSGVSGSGSSYTVTVNTGTGNGTIRLNVVDDDTIVDISLNPLTAGFISGQTYDIEKTAPTVLASLRTSASPTSASSVDFTITFSESVTGVTTNDFNLTTSGVSAAAVSGVSGSGSSYTVTVNTGTGNGTIRLNVVDDDTIVDVALNPLAAGFTNGEIYTILKSATFTDTPLSYWANSYIERLFNAGVTGGCGTGIYCPDATVTRAQMAIFLLKGIHGSSFTPPAINGSTGFTDVATDYWAAAWIKQLAAEGITGGCGPGVYCPDATVTRAQMAIFLLKAKHGSSYSPPAAAGVFTDVPLDYWAAKWIEQLAAEGVTSGCGNGNYCPDSSVTRAQMAVFLVKAFNLP